jgi:hypothetical protein
VADADGMMHWCTVPRMTPRHPLYLSVAQHNRSATFSRTKKYAVSLVSLPVLEPRPLVLQALGAGCSCWPTSGRLCWSAW